MNEQILPRMARKLRLCRQAQNATLQEVADRAGVTKGLLSRIENARTIPSMPVFLSIARALELNLSSFFGELEAQDDEQVLLVRSDTYQLIEKEQDTAGFVYKQILTRLFGEMPVDMVLLNLAPGARRGPVTTDAFEFKYLLRGQVNYHIGDRSYFMEEGDSLFFDGRLPHVPYNPGGEAALMLVIYFYRSDKGR